MQHFQGDKAKHDFLFFARYLLLLKNITLSPWNTIHKANNSNENGGTHFPLLVQASNDYKIFYLTNEEKGKKYLLDDTIIHRKNCSHILKHIFTDIPKDLIQHITYGGVINSTSSVHYDHVCK